MTEQGPHDQPRTKRQWYGWQTLVADGVALTMLIAGAQVGEANSQSGETRQSRLYLRDALIAGGAIGYFLAAPSVHWGHEQVTKGFGSLGLRLVGPTLLLAPGLGGSNSNGGLLLFGLLAVIAPIPIDAAALAWEDVETDEYDGANRAPLKALRLVPMVNPEKHSAGLVLVGNL